MQHHAMHASEDPKKRFRVELMGTLAYTKAEAASGQPYLSRFVGSQRAINVVVVVVAGTTDSAKAWGAECRWCMVHGACAWCLEHGAWSTEHGARMKICYAVVSVLWIPPCGRGALQQGVYQSRSG